MWNEFWHRNQTFSNEVRWFSLFFVLALSLLVFGKHFFMHHLFVSSFLYSFNILKTSSLLFLTFYPPDILIEDIFLHCTITSFLPDTIPGKNNPST